MQNNSVAAIERTIDKLRQLVRLEVQQSWRDLTLLSIVNISHNLAKIDLRKCQTATVNERGYIVFPSGKQVKWLAQKITIPQTLQGYPLSGLSLRLVLTWWAEDARIFINGELVQQGDLFDSSARVLVTDNALPGSEYLIWIELISPYHDIGALMRSHLLYESHADDPGFIADEITVLYRYLAQFEPERLDVLATALNEFDWSNLENADRFGDDLAQLRSRLLPLAENIKRRCFNLLGHAHLDMAWLWTTEETYEVAERTFRSVLSLQQDFPALTFGHTSPALYQWIEENRPELFQQIRLAIASNNWEILGGMWIEPETNLVSGESLIRQLLYGQQYYREKFGNISKVAWLPDSFGFTWQLPQIMQQCGIEYFVTGKLHWNDTTKFPHGCFWWESPDGTRLLTLMSPPNVTGVMDTNPLTMTDYAIAWEKQTGLQEIFWLPGVGDHGGGPTRDMLEVAAKWQKSPFFPELKFSTASDYLNKIGCNNSNDSSIDNFYSPSPQVSSSPNLLVSSSLNLPVWQDELYLELHRGCYTVHADQKQYNRYCERLLYQAELWATLATLLCKDGFVDRPLFPIMNKISGKADLCQAEQLIEVAWKKVLFNQFHDILPGTSIPEVFIEANRDWQTAIAIGEDLLQNALEAIALSIELPEPPQADARPIVVFNSLNWSRSQVVVLQDINESSLVYDDGGRQILFQSGNNNLVFCAKNIPAVGYCLYWICPHNDSNQLHNALHSQSNYQLENQYLKVVVDPQTGDLNSIYDKLQERELLRSAGNKLEAFTDEGQYWDAWNIDPDYEQKRLSETKLSSIEWLECNPPRQIIRVVKQFNRSEFIQDYILEIDSPLLKITNTVNWQEDRVMVKATFPLNIESDRITSEIPCGTIERTTKPQTAAERAKWEIPALNWVDLTDNSGEYGVSLLNDCKYGYDAQSDRLRITLLRSPVWPDPQSDRGRHQFTYAIYPHQHDWKSAKTVQKAYELNTPLQTVTISRNPTRTNLRQLPSRSELLNLSADNLILMALKLSQSEIIMRCYEAHGETARLKLQSDLNLQLDATLDCLENTNTELQQSDRLEPFKIKTFRLKPCPF